MNEYTTIGSFVVVGALIGAAAGGTVGALAGSAVGYLASRIGEKLNDEQKIL